MSSICLNLLYEREINMNENFNRNFAEEAYLGFSLSKVENSNDILLSKHLSYSIPAKILAKTENATNIQFANGLFGKIPNNQFSIYPRHNDLTNIGDIVNVQITDYSPTSIIASRKLVQESSIKYLKEYLKQTVMGTVKEVNEVFIWVELGNGVLCKILNNDLFFYKGYRINFIRAAFHIGEEIPVLIKSFSKNDQCFIGSYKDAFPSYVVQKDFFSTGQTLCCIVTGELNGFDHGYYVLVNPCVNGIVDIPENYEYASLIHREHRITAYISGIGIEKGLHLKILFPYDIGDRS